MSLKRWLGLEADPPEPEDEGEGDIVIRVEVNGKVYTRRYPDLQMAQIRFPQYLADLEALHSGLPPSR
jgi:hypothetical protein